MPVSRPLLIVLIVAVVGAMGFYATRAGQEPTEVAAPVVPPTSTPAQSSERQSAARAEGERSSRRRSAGVPFEVERALDARRKVVLFFYKPWSADDRETARAVTALRGQRDVAVFTDPIDRLARYRGLIGTLGISQAPAVVIVGGDRSARVIEGYVDRATLAQDVADAR
jgi:hypothetical protein